MLNNDVETASTIIKDNREYHFNKMGILIVVKDLFPDKSTNKVFYENGDLSRPITIN